MYFCYLDEAGCTGVLPAPTSPVQPTFVLLGLILHADSISAVTHDFLHLKERFYGRGLERFHGRHERRHYLNAIRYEIKGSELRKDAADPSRRPRRQAIGVLDNLLALFQEHDAKIVAQALVKGIGRPINGRSIYTSYVQRICHAFQHFLYEQDDTGLIIADFRMPDLNAIVSHSVFTIKHSNTGDAIPNIVEMPTFGHSDNHAGLQLADLLSSALLTPCIINYYCEGTVKNVHCRPRYDVLRYRYTTPLRALQHRYQDRNSRWRGGIYIHDALLERKTGDFFASVGT